MNSKEIEKGLLENNINWKEFLTEILKAMKFLDKHTEHIGISCYEEKVIDVKPQQRFK